LGLLRVRFHRASIARVDDGLRRPIPDGSEHVIETRGDLAVPTGGGVLTTSPWSDLADARKPLSTGPRAAAQFVLSR